MTMARKKLGGLVFGSAVKGAAMMALVSGLLAGVGASAEPHGDWTQWRGTKREGSASDADQRREWLARPVMLWERLVGEGYSGPVVAGNRIWVHSRKVQQEIVSSLTLDTGEVLWSGHYEAPFEQDPDALAHGRGPYSTPSLAEGRLFTLGVTSVLSAWDEETGSLLWRRDYSEEFDPRYPYFGAAASPLVWDDLCFVHFGDTGRGESSRGAMVALNVVDGGEKWRWEGDGPALGASPVMVLIEGCRQIVFKTQKYIVGLAPRTGKELWRISFKVPMDNTIVTPLFVGDRLLTSDYDIGFWAWQIRSDGESWSAQELWRNRRVSLFVSSPVIAAGQVVGFSHFRKGQLFVLDPRNGDVLWSGEPRWGEHATLISLGAEVLVFREDGWLIVGEVSANGFRSVKSYRLGSSKMWGHPAVVDDRIVIRDGSRLAVYRLSETAESPR